MANTPLPSDVLPPSHALAALERLAFETGTAIQLDTLFAKCSAEVLSAFGAEAITLFAVDSEGAPPRALHSVGTLPEEARIFAQLGPEDAMSVRVARDGQSRAYLMTDYAPRAAALMSQTRFRAGASVPLQLGGRTLGCLNIGFTRSLRLRPDQLQLLALMGSHIAASLEALRLADLQRSASQTNAQLFEDLRAAGAELARVRSEFSERERMATLGKCAAVVAHEIRNPLGVLSNSLHLLKQLGTSGAQSRSLLGLMSEEVQRMDSLVQDLLEFARPSALVCEPVHVATLLEEVAEGVRAHPEFRGAEVSVGADLGLPQIEADPRLLRQALLNLGINGLQAMGGQGQLTLRATRRENSIRVEVEDQGPGVPEELRERIFEPFVTTRATGTGLGLALVDRVVREHRGSIQLEPGPRGGSRFCLELPTHRAQG